MEQPPSSSSSTSYGNYDVYLSFSEDEVVKNFVDHLYSALKLRGIHTFKDDDKLKTGPGKSISPAIEESYIAIVIFSQHYAESTWCLEELVTIMECMKVNGLVLPIFYDVDPSTVRKQKGKFAEAFDDHEKWFEEEKVNKWKKVLEEVANLSGLELKTENGHEAKFIEKIIEDIFTKLGPKLPSGDPNLIGMERPMQILYSLIGRWSSDVRFIGIFGMSGIGKTAIARALFDNISNEFEGASFVQEVRAEIANHGSAKGLVNLQQKLLSDILSDKNLKINNVFQGEEMMQRLRFKRVLIVLDDVDDLFQLNSLARKGDWFGAGSRIIITTKDKHLLLNNNIESLRLYKMKLLREGESSKLFRQHAFKQDPPPKEFEELAAQVVRHAGGLPLALKVLGSSLCGKDIGEWRNEVARLKEIPKDDDDEITKKLKGSFLSLNDNAQKIFLDIACFFNGKKKASIIRKLESFNFHCVIGVKVLLEKCLIVVLEGRVFMHELIQKMGWHIVRQEASEGPKSYSRLWVPEDISQLLTGSEGTDKIEGIALNYQDVTDVKVSSQAFTGMKNLRFLKFQNANASHGPNSLPQNLRWLDWHGYPSKTFPGSFKGERLVGLKMQYSRVIQLWKGLQDLHHLKFINLSQSQKLIRTPDFRGIPNLERLVLEECKSLTEIHGSVGFPKNLVLLNLKNCINLKKLPKSIHLEKLETLILSGCSKLESFPEIAGPMACLLDVYAEATALRELPSSIEFLTCLRLINLSYCKHLTSLPSSICGLKGLKFLTLSGCSKFHKLPDELGDMECLEELYCDDTAIQELPPSISRLKKLNTLSISGCKPPASQSQYSFFHHLLSPATFQDTKASSLHYLSGLSSLVQLDLRDCSMLDGGIPFDLGALPSLGLLNLSNNKFGSIPAEAFSCLPKLVELFLVGCEKLETLPQLPSSLKTVCLDECTALKGNIGSLTKYKNLNKISITKCDQLLEDEHNSQIMIDAMWQHLLKGVSVEDDNFYICFPGTKIPDQFTYKNWGPSILVDLPRNWYNKKFLGFALCVVSEMIDATKPRHHPNIGVRYGINAKCSLITPDGRKAYVGGGIGFMGIKQYVDSNITCLGYYSFEKWMFYLLINWVRSPNEWCQFEVSSEKGYSENIVHKGFGVRLMYEEDDGKQSDEAVMSQSSSSQSQFGEIVQS